MRFNPNTKLNSLLTAVPSAATVCAGFHMTIDGNEDKSLGQLCAERGITFDSFLQALDELDWNEEYPPEQSGSNSNVWKA